MTSLRALATGVYAWIADEPRLGRPNAGVVLDADGATVIDTGCTPAQGATFAEAVEALGFPVRRIVLTGDHLEYTGGSTRFPMAAVFGTRVTSGRLDQPPQPDVLRRLYPAEAADIDDEITTRTVSHLVVEPAELTPALYGLPLAGQSLGNLVALVVGEGILFAGALAWFGVTPLAFDGHPAAWAATLDSLADLAPVVVPGHGPVGGPEDLRIQAAYLRACVDAAGDPGALPPGPWDTWPGREWDAVNVERAAMIRAGDGSVPPTMLRAVGLA
ncbi:MAG: MBL fold metallo-hydrolase [Actinobacteria bacterium]|nr:MBL fold metallo-hydrolase [Actinomycetota bacterium]